MRSNLAICFAFLMVISSCWSGTSEWISKVPLQQDDILTETVWMDVPSDSLYSPTAIVKVGDMIIMADATRRSALALFDCRDKSFKRMLNIGRSREEVMNVHQMFPYGEYLAVVDNLSKKMMFLDLNTHTVKRVYDIGNYSSVAVKNDSVVGTLLSSDARYGKSSLNHIRSVCGFMDYSEYGLSNSSGSGLMQGHVLANDGSRLAWFGYYSAVYQIVDFSDEIVVRSEIIEDPVFNNHGQQYATFRPDSKTAFISVTGNNEGIYALYDGKKLLHYMNNRGQKPYGNTILRFDWKGDIMYRCDSSLPIQCLYVDEDKLYLCVLTEDGDYRIGYYSGF